MNPFAIFGLIYTALARPIEWSLEQLTKAFDHVSVISAVGSFGVAVIVVTLIIRTLLFPLYGWQIRTSRRVQAEQRLIAPQLQELRKKYKGDPQTLNAETMKLYREHNLSPFSAMTGCLPLLVQFPILGGLYFGIRNAVTTLQGEHLHPGFLWIGDLSKSAKDAAGGSYGDLLMPEHLALLLLPVVAALATVVQSRMMMQPARPDMSDQERQMYNASKQVMLVIPVMILLMGLSFQQGIALYWVTQSFMMIAQSWVILGWGGLRVPDWFPGAGRITPLSYSNPASTSLAALGSKAILPKANPVKVSSGRSQRAPAARPAGEDRDARPSGRAERRGEGAAKQARTGAERRGAARAEPGRNGRASPGAVAGRDGAAPARDGSVGAGGPGRRAGAAPGATPGAAPGGGSPAPGRTPSSGAGGSPGEPARRRKTSHSAGGSRRRRGR